MAYTKQNWEDYPSTNTLITASRLNHIEDGIYEADSDAEEAKGIANSAKTIANEVLADVPFAFGIDEDGNYGYKKLTEETVTPFDTGGGISRSEVQTMIDDAIGKVLEGSF